MQRPTYRQCMDSAMNRVKIVKRELLALGACVKNQSAKIAAQDQRIDELEGITKKFAILLHFKHSEKYRIDAHNLLVSRYKTIDPVLKDYLDKQLPSTDNLNVGTTFCAFGKVPFKLIKDAAGKNVWAIGIFY